LGCTEINGRLEKVTKGRIYWYSSPNISSLSHQETGYVARTRETNDTHKVYVGKYGSRD